MNIAIVGYGKMGKTIERIAESRGHKIAAIIDMDNQKDLFQLKDTGIDVAIEFTQPDSAYHNISGLLKQGISVVSGTTGWLDRKDEIENIVRGADCGFFYAPNYSIGVNLFFAINEYAAKLMNRFTEFNVRMEEVHHVQKLDAPSGTAIHLAEDIIRQMERKTSWKNETDPDNSVLEIISERLPEVAGIHRVFYSGPYDEIKLEHHAEGRSGFATGAVIAAEFLREKKGVYSMKDILYL